MRAIILAAGKGVRMNSSLPKVLHAIKGKPLAQYVVDSLRSISVESVSVVVGYGAEKVKDALGDSLQYALQEQQLGTGHAVLQAEPFFVGYKGPVIIACGDAPFISPQSFENLLKLYDNDRCMASVLTMITDNPTGYGRIVKDDEGNVLSIIEEKDASDSEKAINEVNTGTYVVDSALLFKGLKSVGTNNAQGEYYLPDIVKYINKSGFCVKSSILEDNREGIGINNPEELLQAEKLYNEF
ncbi:MAG: NTP transferase domain-containing protein [Spirochaetes bacterium]|jgi:bifunctional UDP-N-acetylglucosamine pyrophosphorylase/glucosamine-1-phosphate N-acetyltransferase|nr:NTP transferase domain-containing protein [Spirochaetota bacterium]